MKLHKMKTLPLKASFIALLSCAACLLASVAMAEQKTIFVDQKVETSGDGTSWEKAFKTIQEAITASSVDDVIRVAAGVYDQGTTNVWKYSHGNYQNVWQQSRVFVDKRLTILGAGKDVTTIMGDQGTYSSDNTGKAIAYRVDGVQCLVVGDNATGTVIRGFRFEKGTPNQIVASGNLAAGGVCRYTPRADNDFLVTDCEFVDCIGRAAGGITGGTAIRCIFTRCMTNYGGSSAYRSRLYNCLSRDANEVKSGELYDFCDCYAVNCTTIGNWYKGGYYHSGTTAFGGVYWNCATYGNAYFNMTDTHGVASNCVSDISFGSEDADCRKVDNVSVEQMTQLNLCYIAHDYRVVRDGLLDGKGKRDYIAAAGFIPADEVNVDFEGRPIAADAAIPVGIIMPSVEVGSGYVEFQNFYYLFNGFACARYTGVFLQSDHWPAEFRVTLNEAKHTALVKLTGPYPVYPGLQGDIQIMLPPKGTTVGAVGASRCQAELYVDDDAKEGGTGTAESPFRTIQDAVDALADKTATIIHVAAGTYGGVQGKVDVGGAVPGFRATVVVPRDKSVFIRADEGPEVTFIEGCPDPDTKGCGPNATCCASVNGNTDCAFAGFTFRNGYAYCNDGSDSNGKSYGAATVCGNNGGAQQFYDCVFTGHHGRGVSYGGWFVRCLFTGNVDSYSCLLHNATISSCILRGNRASSYLLYNTVHAYNCSLYDTDMTKSIQNINGKCVNCAYDSAGTWLAYTVKDSSSCPIIGSVIKAASYQSGSIYESSYVRADPCFRDPSALDFRLSAPSAGEGIGVATDPYGKISQADMIKYLRGDYFNNPLADAEGRINAGAVSAVTTCCLYADAENGKDDAEHDGSSEAKAKKTLAAVMASASYFPANARVVALPGHYDSGSMIQTTRSFDLDVAHRGTLKVRSRVLVPENVTLISRDGPEVTFIDGAADPESTDPKGWGRGPNAIRCVFLEKNATVSGFTISGGRSDWHEGKDIDGSQYQDDFFSGGVFGRDASPKNGRLSGCKVVNCVITGNRAEHGGAGAIVSFYDSTITGNYAGAYGGCARHAAAYNCYVDACNGPRLFDCLYGLVNVTVGPDILSGSSWTYLADNIESGCRIWNVLTLMNNNGTQDFKGSDVRNVVFPKDVMKVKGTGTWENVNTNTYTRAELLELYADGRPKASDAPTVDVGYAEAAALFGDRDPAGVKRILNGALDIGAYEYDWTVDYAASFASKKLQVVVTDVSSTVEMEDGHPKMSDGDEMTVFWPSKLEDGRNYQITAVLEGAGTLSVYLNGVLLGTMTSSGMLPFDLSQSLPDGNELRFSYSGEGDAYVAKLCRDPRGMMLLVR